MFDFSIVTQWVHSLLTSFMPEELAVLIECIVIGVCIMLAYAVIAIIMIFMERKVCAAFQCRLGQIETDRRIILDKIARLKEELKAIDRQKAVQRKNRGKLTRVALVGYTNVGKSTLMNLLSKSDVFAENKLFATLDTTVRKVTIDNLPFLLTDTVGFIRKLPTHLVDSFKSTLDEVREADILVHVVDISHPNFEEQIEVVNKTLAEVCGGADKPTLLVFNKIDAFTYKPKDADDLTPRTRENASLEELKETWMARMNDQCVFISAKKGTNIDELKQRLYEMAKEVHLTRFPYNDFLYQKYDDLPGGE